MKKLRFLSLALMSASMVFLLTSCPGPMGPEGEKGNPGIQGPQGVAGQTGAQGPAGTANVIYSSWITATSIVSGSYFSRAGSYFDLTVPKLTQEILDKGMVLTYWKPAGNNQAIIPLPASTGDVTGSELYPEYKVSRIRIWLFNTGTFSTSNQFRYVIIPGSVNARKANIDYSNYEEVKKAYNLPD